MAMFPMRQTIMVKRPSDELDRWGNPINEAEEFTLKCRIDEGSTVVKARNNGVVKSEEAVASARILLDRLADVRYTDVISYTNELGETMEKRPKEINVKRHIDGKALLTEVYL
ncbi:hypothetical protein FO510_05615 [Bacillus pumilus]|uniref:hypothetical protein n=1 Tax=Bacillus pumilus TaxID=1408 RepID=UPI00017A5EE8|nr:hypothetical protein [Bacillus pumilus]EDW22152.1 conserved hypothetical protein [Bacillus pumilus ATCC 7061]MCR4352153.1 hypothetical protein [Bacillus pumilus]MCY7503964.1 hypothetical protein [Bacillus pumilus]MDR4269042.1 hypothetical protein [Bacillus pumilus]MDR4269129.1 hypothetical protein [Bacillus pumilus]